VKELERNISSDLDQSSAVQVMVDLYGPVDFILRSKTQPDKTDHEGGPVYQLLGGPVNKNIELAKRASPVNYIDENDPPLLIIHGLSDTTVNPGQSITLCQRYKKMGLPVDILLVPDGGHGGKEYQTPEVLAKVVQFVNQHLPCSK